MKPCTLTTQWKRLKPARFLPVLMVLLQLAVPGAPRTAQAQQNWKATVGGQGKNMAKQAVAFLPNELWIHEGDSITWTFVSGDIHTVTFLTVGQVYPFDFTQGCPPPVGQPSMAPRASPALPPSPDKRLP
jgi:plastocyanin